MFGRRQKTANTFRDFLQQHGREMVRQVYLGVLEREPDLEGLDGWTGFLRDSGSLDELLRRTLASREFLNSVNERLDTFVDPLRDLATSPRRIVVLANCQGGVLARAIQAFTGWMPLNHRMVGYGDWDDPSGLVAAVRKLAAEYDLILMQPVTHALLERVAPELLERVELFPNLGFNAFHPDQCEVYRHPQLHIELTGALNVYHSSIAYYAWRAGMSAREACDHFRDEVYAALRFYDYWEASVQVLRNEGAAANLPVDHLVERWRARGCFVHSPQHPRLYVIADVARLVVQRMGIEPLPIEPADILHDLFGSGAVWPVYPEIAARLGMQGNYLFKPVNAGVSMMAPVRHIDLGEFVDRSYAAFGSVDREQLRCDRSYSERYRNVFGRLEQAVRIVVPPSFVPSPPKAGATATHPYADLPVRQSWRRAVAALPVSEVDPVGTPGFVLTPATRIVTAGSCFAQHISRTLKQRGCAYQVSETAPAGLTDAEARARNYGVYSARYGNLYTARQLVQLVDRACSDFTPAEAAWERPDGRWADPFRPEIEPGGFASVADLEADRARHLAAVRALLGSLDVFVFTLGLTEAWQSRVDGAVFPLAPGVVAGRHDPTLHSFVNFDYDQVLADLEAFVERLRRLNPTARMLLTVSPVPLAATWQDRHVLTATVHSKSVLRAAADALCRRHAHVDYFPAYEIVAAHYNRGGYYGADQRTVTQAGVDHVMRLFFAHLLPSASPPAADMELLAEATQIVNLVCEEVRLDQTAAN